MGCHIPVMPRGNTHVPDSPVTASDPGGGGFTLVELVMVILLLGVMATFSSQFIGIGTQIYGDASRREQLMSDARFAMERLNREVRDAVPGSVRVEDEGAVPRSRGPVCGSGPSLPPAATWSLNKVQASHRRGLSPCRQRKIRPSSIRMPDRTSGSTITLDNGVCAGRCTARVTEVGPSPGPCR